MLLYPLFHYNGTFYAKCVYGQGITKQTPRVGNQRKIPQIAHKFKPWNAIEKLTFTCPDPLLNMDNNMVARIAVGLEY